MPQPKPHEPKVTRVSALAGRRATDAPLVDVRALIDAYYELVPDPADVSQRVAFGTSGHRGVSLLASFNEAHVLAITQAICAYRARRGVSGPLFIGCDTHALSAPAFDSALEVLAANGVTTLVSAGGEFTPTPAVSHAILCYNRGRNDALADGIVVSPSHNPPDSGGFKYNPPNGGPADSAITQRIEADANALLAARLQGVARMPLEQARKAATNRVHDYLGEYVADLQAAIDFDCIRAAHLRIGVDPLGGAGVHYWKRIAERYGIELNVVNERVDPTFSFMSLDWDGKVRMDPSSAYAMQSLLALKDSFDLALACDTDHDRHGIVTPQGLMLPNEYLSVCIDYLFRHRPQWSERAAVGKTVVSSSMIDRVTAAAGRSLYEVPTGFKWFAEGLYAGRLGFAGEESAGSTFLRRDGSVWTTDKDGIVAALLAAEMTARRERDPQLLYDDLTHQYGKPYSTRIDAPATTVQKQKLAKLAPSSLNIAELAGAPIQAVLDKAPSNQAPIGGIKVVTGEGWFAARPSGTEDIYKIYAESFRGEEHLQRIVLEAQAVVDSAIA